MNNTNIQEKYVGNVHSVSWRGKKGFEKNSFHSIIILKR